MTGFVFLCTAYWKKVKEIFFAYEVNFLIKYLWNKFTIMDIIYLSYSTKA